MKIKSTICLLAAVILSISTVSAFAQAQAKAIAGEVKTAEAKLIETRFSKADKNSDGKLTLDEAKAGMPMVAKDFAKIDTGNTGYVTLDQVKAFMAGGATQVAAKVTAAATASSTSTAPATSK